MNQIHEITLQLVDARLKMLQQELSGCTDMDRMIQACLSIQRKLKLLLDSEDVAFSYSEAIILWGNCQSCVETLSEFNMIDEALEVFRTECAVLAHSELTCEDPSRIATRMADHLVRLFFHYPFMGDPSLLQPFLNTAFEAVPGRDALHNALQQAKIVIEEPY